MSLYNIVNPSSIVPGQPEDVSQVLANFQAIQSVLNGGIDDVNIRSTAAISPSKLAGYPADAKQSLRGDGSWGQDEIGYDQITTTVNIVATSLPPTAIVAGSAHTFDGNPVIMEFFSPAVQLPSVGTGSITVLLMEAGVNIGVVGLFQNPAAATMRTPVLCRYRFTPSAGSHTYGISAYASSTTGVPFVGAGAAGLSINTPAYIRFTKAIS